MTGDLMDIATAAKRLGVRYTWLRDAVTARRVPHTRIGRHVRFTDEHLAQIVAAGEQPAVNAPAVAAHRSATHGALLRFEPRPGSPARPPSSGPRTASSRSA